MPYSLQRHSVLSGVFGCNLFAQVFFFFFIVLKRNQQKSVTTLIKCEICEFDSFNMAVYCATILFWCADKAPHPLKPNPPPTQAHGCLGLSLLHPSLNSF